MPLTKKQRECNHVWRYLPDGKQVCWRCKLVRFTNWPHRRSG